MTTTETHVNSKRASRVFTAAAIFALIAAVAAGNQETSRVRTNVFANRIEVQVSQAFRAGEVQSRSVIRFPTENPWPGPGEGPEGEMCREELRKIFQSRDLVPNEIPPDTVSTLYQINLCHFYDPRTRTSLNAKRIIGTATAAFVGTSIGVFLGIWIGQYKHAGWRRLSIATGAISVMGAVIIAWVENATFAEAIILVASAGITVPSLILTTREVALWIRNGFSNPNSDA